MTTQPAHPAKSTGTDVKTFATAVLLTFGAGMLGMVGWGLLSSGFGFFLGLVAAGFGLYWWRSLHGGVITAKLPTRSVVVLFVVDAILMVALFLMTR
ncbi:hypothetical protein [Amycolatopsis panacis]|uniref:Uncharacterized protein n=1 Tax=Amycolatopsis panacis TaxID=2340917 RepID=A0A419I869_9PSEU|nr:hypothetical protein [Amycolatopsis panacis]RJQ88277.1 hypothetical protein D5S19_07090 [Amycolatopsis panacis]